MLFSGAILRVLRDSGVELPAGVAGLPSAIAVQLIVDAVRALASQG